MKRAFFIAFLIATMPSLAWSAATATIGAAKDNTIYQSNSNNSGGGAPGFFAGTNNQASNRRALIAFDIASNVPGGSIITAAQLTLYLGNAPNTTSRNIELHKLIKNWGEGTAGNTTLTINGSGNGFTANLGDATWSDAMLGSTIWANPGATGDFNATASAIASVGGPTDTPFTWTSTAALVSDVQSWLDDPSSNFGWALTNASEGTSQSVKAFYSREATQNSSNVPNSLDPTWRPSLSLTYVETGDYNRSGAVDAADFTSWRKTLSQPASPLGSGADGDQSGTIDDGDYAFWRERITNGFTAFAGSAAIPEPAGFGLIVAIGPLVLFPQRRYKNGIYKGRRRCFAPHSLRN